MSPQFLWPRWLAQHVARLAGQVGHCPASRWARLHQRHSALPGRLALIASPASLSTAAWPRQLRVEVTVDAVAAHVAERLHRALEQAAVLGLATGRTMEPVYAALLSRILALVPAEREPLLARLRWVPFIGQFWPLTSLTPGGRNRVRFQCRPHGEFCLPGSCVALHGSTSIGSGPG